MMKYYKIRPKVAGGFGPRTVFEEVDGLRVLRFAHIEVHTWPDAMIKTVSFSGVCETLKNSLVSTGITGVDFRPCELTRDEQFEIGNPDRPEPLPLYFQLLPGDSPYEEDIGRDQRALIVSERVKAILDRFGATDLEFEFVRDVG